LTVKDTAGNVSLEVKNFGNSFGTAVTGGAFISRNSYWGEEFNRFQTNNCSQTTTTQDPATRGDLGTSPAACANTGGEIAVSNVLGAAAGGNTCVESSQNAINGTERISAQNANTVNNKASCLEYISQGTTAGTANKPFAANNLPVVTMKITPSTYAANANALMIAGLGASGATTLNTMGMPTDGVFFSNCTTYSTTAPSCPAASPVWNGFVVSGSALVGTVQACSAGAETGNIVQAKTSYLRIEVRANNDIHFFVDTDTSTGIKETECGTGVTGTGPGATGLTMWLQSTYNAQAATTVAMDVDYFRVYQDENVDTSTDTTTTDTSSSTSSSPTSPDPLTVAPISPDSADPAIVGSFFSFLGATSNDTVFDHNVFVHGTLYADKIKANEIEGLSIFTDQLASLQQKLAQNSGTSTNPTSTTTNNTVVQTATMSLNLSDGLTVGGDAHFQGNVFFYKLVTFTEKTLFNNDVTFAGHIATDGAVPTTTLQPAAGDSTGVTLSASASVDGNDNSGQINVTTGDNATSGKLITVSFNRSFAKAPRIVLTATNDQAAAVKYYVQTTATGFTIYVIDQLSSGANLQFNYLVVQ
jgi:hypothetical protein